MTLLTAQVCTTVCNDHDESCKGWTKAGECETNKAFMHRVCPCAAPRHEHARTPPPRSHPRPLPSHPLALRLAGRRAACAKSWSPLATRKSFRDVVPRGATRQTSGPSLDCLAGMDGWPLKL